MNRPRIRSAPSPPCMRPNRTVPKTTLWRPVTRASTSAPGQVTEARGTHAESACVGADALAQRGFQIQLRLRDARAVSLHLEQAERCSGLVNVAQHVLEESFVLFLADAQPGLCYQIAKRQGSGQLLFAALQMGVDFFLQDVERGVVARQVMEQFQHQPAPAHRIVGDEKAQQRRFPQIDPVMTRIEAGIQLIRRVAGMDIESDFLDAQDSFALHHLHRFGKPFPEDRGSQDVMPIDDRLHCAQVPIELLAAVEGREAGQQIRIAMLGHQMMEKNAFLQRRQRVMSCTLAAAPGMRATMLSIWAKPSLTSGSMSGVRTLQSAGIPLGGNLHERVLRADVFSGFDHFNQ